MTPSSNPPSPAKITGQLISAFRPAALLAALQLDVFTALGDEALAVDELARALSVQPRRLRPILNVLVLTDLLRLDGERFLNGEEAAYYLVKGRPGYIGGIHELYADMYRAVLSTAESIREDRPVAEHDFGRMTDEALAAFFRGLHGLGVVQGRQLAKQHEFDRFGALADVGGGSGNMAIGACEACPRLRATVLELDRITAIARQFIGDAGLADRITVAECDIARQEPDATYDVAVLRSVLQVLPPDQAAGAIENIGRRIRTGGEIYILGYVLDDSRLAPWEAAAWDVAFLNIYRGGRSYTDAEHRDWLRAAGFGKIQRTLLPVNTSLVKATKL